MILLLNQRRCPTCAFDSVSLDAVNRACTACGTRLWKSTDDFTRFELETGQRHYYVWFTDKGWVHADRIKEGFKPNQATEAESLLVSY